MNRFIFLFCLVLAGCATVSKDNKAPLRPPKGEPYVAVDQEELEHIIAVFSKAIEANPSYGGAYCNRAVAYFYNKEYARSWDDLRKAKELGMQNDPLYIDLLSRLQKVSGRQK
jgi:Tfp pilus assembly protein PilF